MWFVLVWAGPDCRMIELDSKSLNSLAGTTSTSGHSRKGSDASQISFNSGEDCLFFFVPVILVTVSVSVPTSFAYALSIVEWAAS